MRRNVCIRMNVEEIAWLQREKQPMSEQYRKDFKLLNRLLWIARAQPHMPIGEALKEAKNP